MLSACTIIAGNYLPQVRVFADSFFAHHPDGSLTVLIIDDEERQLQPDDRRIDWRRLSEIGLDPAEIHRQAAMYDVTELATAVKPLLLRQMLNEGHAEVIYLDPDIRLYDSLADVLPLARRHGIVLTPHTTEPFPHDGGHVDALFVLAAGVYNLGFIAIGESARPFLDWWALQTRRGALNDVTRMMFTDQRWVDFVPSLFEHCLLKDPGYNVAYWNLHARQITADGDRYLVNGAPLRFFHFSGFDVHQPWLLSRHQGERPRILLSEQPTLTRLCHDYADAVVLAGHGQGPTRPYGWQTAASGLDLTERLRRLYWRAMIEAEQTQTPEPPNPFDAAQPDGFVDWLNAPAPGSPRWMSRYVRAIYEARLDLQSHFPHVGGRDAERLIEWLWRDGVTQEKIPLELLPPRDGDLPASQQTAPGTLAPGLNIAGYFRSELGIGEAARLLTTAVSAADIPYATITTRHTLIGEHHRFEERATATPPYDVNLLCVNADGLAPFAQDAGPSLFAGRHTIGYWFWEVNPLPLAMRHSFNYVDEVWTATDYIAGILRTAGDKPVFTVPVPIVPPAYRPGVTREQLGLPDRFTFLLLFDFLSVAQRKNPLGLIEAFTKAFAPDEGPLLLLKSTHGHLCMGELERLRLAIAKRPDIMLLDAGYRAEDKNALLALCDCYVSLHRAEGLGLTLAEAMSLGKPAIATGYSGNRHFMTPENSYLIDYTLASVPHGCGSYPPGAIWAEPDLQHAARVMREVYERPREAQHTARRGQADILNHHGIATTVAALTERLEEIRRGRAQAQAHSVAISRTEDAAAAARVAEVVGVDVAVDVDALVAESIRVNGERPAEQPSAEQPRVAPPAVVSALEALLQQVQQLGRPRLSHDGRRWQGLRRLSQRVLFRAMRPYAFQQGQFQEALSSALLSSVRTLASELAAANSRADLRDVRQQQLEQRLEQSDAQLKTLSTALADTTAETKASITSLSERLFAAPFLDGREQFVQRTPSGVVRLGYGQHTGGNGHGLGQDNSPAPAHSNRHSNGRSSFQNNVQSSARSNGPGDGHSNGQSNSQSNGQSNGHHAQGGERAQVFGAEPLFRARQRLYLPLLQDRARVLDVHCGRGRMLDLLRIARVPALGIEPDPNLVSHCRANGHIVELAEALPFLRARARDAEVDAIFSARMIEQLPFDQLEEFLQLCRARLTLGGLLIAEVRPGAAPDPNAAVSRPALRPEVALALCRVAGFEEAQVLFHAERESADGDHPPSGSYAIAATARRQG